MYLLKAPFLAPACLALALACSASMAFAQTTERTRQKQQAESERATLRQQIGRLKRDIMQTEAARNHAADALASSETAISQANLALRELSSEEKETAAKLKELSKRQETLARQIQQQQDQLAALLRQQYQSGNEDRLKLLLSGGNPNKINRDLHYMGHISKAQTELIESLRNNLTLVEKNKAETQNTREELAEIAEEQRKHKSELEKEKLRHAALVAQLAGKLHAQRLEAGEMQRNEQRLSGLVDKLAALIKEQRRAELAEAQRRKAVQAKLLEQQKAAQVKLTPREEKKETRIFPDPIDTDENPSKSFSRGELAREARVQEGGFSTPFSALRGKLRLPVKGELSAKYGGRREDGPSWKGLFIKAAEGADVRSVAAGQVVFAEWLRGFGNLIIVDHGSQYMTIYGNNQALLKHVGDAVKPGEVIASIGNSGGNEQSGLYFEMRHQGRAFDPLGWIAIR